jgi:hypothetical protein
MSSNDYIMNYVIGKPIKEAIKFIKEQKCISNIFSKENKPIKRPSFYYPLDDI